MTDKRKKKGKVKSASNIQVYKGKLEITRNGTGFVTIEGQEKDILVNRGDLNNALDGDEVRIEVRGYLSSKKRQAGTIIEVIKRKRTEFSGKVEVHPHFAFLLPDSEKISVDIYIPLHLLNGAKNGDHATARIVEWNPKNKNPIGEIINVLTYASLNEIAMQNILTENGFPLTFIAEVLNEATNIPDSFSDKEIKKRKDFRETLTITIDPLDAKDFDDAISFKAIAGGWYEVGIHIADVSYYIKEGSLLDQEAYHRATSVYLPDRVLPMLPEHLSNGLCSLKPNEDKYTFSVVIKINKKGKVIDKWVGRTVINSNRRFNYEEVQCIIETGKGDYVKEILVLNEIAQNLREHRFIKGAINFSSQEVRFKLDENAKPIGIEIKESKYAHQLIEEFMLLANRTIAEFVGNEKLYTEPIPFPYRVHDVPNDDKLKIFTGFAKKFGVKFDLSSSQAISKSFNEMLLKVTGKPEQHVLEQLGIRTMSKAIYTTNNIGHYGLGFDYYCHFTSPIRRYPDILVHRILAQCLDDKIKPKKNLELQCRHCSDQERKAMEAERAANKYKQVEFMQEFVGDDFDAIISGVSAFGFWAETIDYKCEGLVMLNDLIDIDSFVFRENEYCLEGRQTGIKFAMGNKVKVKLLSANLLKRQLDFSVVDIQRQKHKMPKNEIVKKRRRKDV